MSTRQKGNVRENRCGVSLRAYGYEPFYSRGSRGVDILAVKADGCGPHLLIAVIRPSGNIRENFQKLREGPSIAGAIRVVAKEVTRAAWRWYANEDAKPVSLSTLLLEVEAKGVSN